MHVSDAMGLPISTTKEIVLQTLSVQRRGLARCCFEL